MGKGERLGGLIAVIGVLSVAPPAAAAPDPEKLTPVSSYSAVVPVRTVLPPGVAVGKLLPGRAGEAQPVPLPKVPPPLSSPLVGTTFTKDSGAAAVPAAVVPAAIPQPVTAAVVRVVLPERRTEPPPVRSKEPERKEPERKEPKSVESRPYQAAAAGERVFRYASTEINVRPRPDRDARRIDVIDEGTRVEIVSPLIDKEWVKIARHGREIGYVSAEYLIPRPPKPR